MSLESKVAIVTGARRGIGRGIALALAEADAHVVVSDVDQADCQKVVDEIQRMGKRALAVKCDVTKKAEAEALVRQAVDAFGKVDILVNNAGICHFKPFLELTEEEWDETLDINLKGQFLCAQAAAREMIKNRWGRIINIASVASGQTGIGFPNLAHYCASKGGVTALTEAMSVELAPLGINVNAIAPGVIDTPMVDAVRQNPAAMQQMLSRVPKGRMGTPEDIGHLAVFLASGGADYINGATIFIDGGWMAS